MERNEQRHDTELMTDLGQVTAETKGPGILFGDILGEQQVAGLSDD